MFCQFYKRKTKTNDRSYSTVLKLQNSFPGVKTVS